MNEVLFIPGPTQVAPEILAEMSRPAIGHRSAECARLWGAARSGLRRLMQTDAEIVMLTAFLHPKEGLATLRAPLTIEPIGMAVPPGDVLLVNFLENAMGALEASGFMSAVRARWLENSDWVAQLP